MKRDDQHGNHGRGVRKWLLQSDEEKPRWIRTSWKWGTFIRHTLQLEAIDAPRIHSAFWLVIDSICDDASGGCCVDSITCRQQSARVFVVGWQQADRVKRRTLKARLKS